MPHMSPITSLFGAWGQRLALLLAPKAASTTADATLLHVAACEAAALRAEAACQLAINAALVASEAAEARGRGAGDGWRGGLDSDLETLDTRR